MTNPPPHQRPGSALSPLLSRRNRLVSGDDDESTNAWSSHPELCEKWAPTCPDGNPQRLCHALGFRERNTAELELRVALGGPDRGVCEVVVEERGHEVYVRVLVCQYTDVDEPASGRLEYTDCPVRVWLEQPLGTRAVIDVDSDEELPEYVPRYLNNVIQMDHGYHPANRRQGRPSATPQWRC